MDVGPLSAVIAERQEVGNHEVTPETTKQRILNVGRYNESFTVCVCVCVFVLLIQGVSSLGYYSCELHLPSCIYLKPVVLVL